MISIKANYGTFVGGIPVGRGSRDGSSGDIDDNNVADIDDNKVGDIVGGIVGHIGDISCCIIISCIIVSAIDCAIGGVIGGTIS